MVTSPVHHPVRVLASPQLHALTAAADSGSIHRDIAQMTRTEPGDELAPGKGIQAHRESGDTLHTYVALTEPQDWFDAIDFTDAAAAAARIAQEFDGWAPELTALITDSDTAPVLRALHALPIGLRWDRVPGVTLIGDAAHVSAPNGEGANLAMFDGAELGRAIAAHPDDVDVALTEYEQAMFLRGAEAAADGAELHEFLVGDNAPHSLVSAFLDDGQTP